MFFQYCRKKNKKFCKKNNFSLYIKKIIEYVFAVSITFK